MDKVHEINKKKLENYNKVNESTILFPTKINIEGFQFFCETDTNTKIFYEPKYDVTVVTNDDHFIESNKTFLSSISVLFYEKINDNKDVKKIKLDISKAQYEKIKKYYSFSQYDLSEINFESFDELVDYYEISYKYSIMDLNYYTLVRILMIHIYDDENKKKMIDRLNKIKTTHQCLMKKYNKLADIEEDISKKYVMNGNNYYDPIVQPYDNKENNNYDPVLQSYNTENNNYDPVVKSYDNTENDNYDLVLQSYDNTEKLVHLKTNKKLLMRKSTYFNEIMKTEKYKNQPALLLPTIRDVYLKGIINYINDNNFNEIYYHIDDVSDYISEFSIFINRSHKITIYYVYAIQFGIQEIKEKMLRRNIET